MKYSTIVPAFLFLAGSALLPISSDAMDLPSDAKEDCQADETACDEAKSDAGDKDSGTTGSGGSGSSQLDE